MLYITVLTKPRIVHASFSPTFVSIVLNVCAPISLQSLDWANLGENFIKSHLPFFRPQMYKMTVTAVNPPFSVIQSISSAVRL